MNLASQLPIEIPGYQGGPLTHQPGLLSEPLFVVGHLYGCVHSEEAEEALFGADYEASDEFRFQLNLAGQWPVYVVPLRKGHRIYVVYRTIEDDSGVDDLVYHPAWDVAEPIASDDGHFRGPGLSWAELSAAAFSGIRGGSTDDPYARTLLLLPALGDSDLSVRAAETVAQALNAFTGSPDARLAAQYSLKGQGPAGPARWSVDADGVLSCDGRYAYRSTGALAHGRLARISAALTH